MKKDWWVQFVRGLLPYSALAEAEDSATSRLRSIIPPTGERPDLLARQQRGETLAKPRLGQSEAKHKAEGRL